MEVLKLRCKLIVWQSNQKSTIQCEKGDNLLEVLLNYGYEIKTYCGGKGTCGKCKIKVLSKQGQLTFKEKDLLDTKEINNGIRLACLTTVKEDMEIELEDSGEIEVMTSGIRSKVEKDLKYKKEYLTLIEPSLTDQRDFTTRIFDNLSLENINLVSLKELDKLNKEKSITVTIRDKNVVQIEAGNTTEDLYGIAVDIGTTTVVLYLLDLNSGEEIDVYSLYNPQKKFGADVISRINYTIDNNNGIEKMKKVLIEGLNKGISELQKRNEISKKNILMITVVGNTVMLHTLLGMNTETIAQSPYIPLFTGNLELKPEELGLEMNERGLVQILPSISGYIGADIVGDMLTVNFNTCSNKINLMIDIGTNGELALSTGEEIYTCSTAAGPAFEGANITFGMAGVPGAISEFKLSNGQPEYKTIKDQKPEGICGSGLLDIMAELYQEGLIDGNGSFVSGEKLKTESKDRMTEYKDMKAYRIVAGEQTESGNDILLTQKDIREVQLAKGAIQAGIEILKKEVDIKYEDINKVYIAGGFGNYIDPHNACVISLIPPELEEKIVQIGNGAGTGAKLYLLDKKSKIYVEEMKKKVKYIELSSRQDFQAEFMGAMQF